ncbi:Protein LURP-one-related like [Quillaja saponaria]|uniref:Protein LURP-one-related like n=1 Tax=Quillaja saponaria TaxID=32244 RepID=A0AAD7KRU5_QUISA|nr:Protein LURP-one-related like [Quillaja saponaria]
MAQKVVLKIMTMDDEKTKQKAIEEVADVFGVDSIAADIIEQKLTITGDMDTIAVAKKLKKIGKIDILSGKIYPGVQENIASPPKRETFTVWMKSLVCHLNGCTVYDSKGQIVYRVDNYDKKGSREVHLMDLHGTILYTIRQKLLAFGRWDGYRCSSSGYSSNCNDKKKEKPYFQVQRYCKLIMGNIVCEIKVGRAKYWIVRSQTAKLAFRIVNVDGDIVAQAEQKLSSSGVILGDDVVTLEVESWCRSFAYHGFCDSLRINLSQNVNNIFLSMNDH